MSLRFDEGFMEHYAGTIISDPHVALVELVANAYDAGATRVDIVWPAELGGEFSLKDNGTGMTRGEFEERWATLSYNRLRRQGGHIEYPPDFAGRRSKRPAFGRNGQGRLGAFCFANEYGVETWRDGLCTSAVVRRASTPDLPFEYGRVAVGPRQGHGTRVSARISHHWVPATALVETIGSKFAVVPWLTIALNGEPIELTDISGLATETIAIAQTGHEVTIHTLSAEKRDRTTFLRGIAWWVNGRMVGEPSWSGLDRDGAFLDGRSTLAGSCSFIVKADDLQDAVKHDWSGFHDTPDALSVQRAVREHVLGALGNMEAGRRKQRKAAAIDENRAAIEPLPRLRRRMLGEFIDRMQELCPSMSDRDLGRAVQVFAHLEAATTGFDLLKRLAQCSPQDLDTWERLMREWTAAEAALVLDELGRRLQLLTQLEARTADSGADELHEIHPLVARGLWMFGPEFEAVEFMSNRQLSTVVARLFGEGVISSDAHRPDLVALADGSLSVHSCDAFDDDSEPRGLAKVLVVELKRSGIAIGLSEMFQARRYIKELRDTGAVQPTTQITAYVLGQRVAENIRDETTDDQKTTVRPETYGAVIRRAHARTFHLHQRLQALSVDLPTDPEIDEVLATPQLSLVEEE